MIDVVPIVLRVPRAEIAYVKFVFESYEGVAVCRTLDRHAAILAVLAVPDFEPVARRVVAALVAEGVCVELPPPANPVDWLGTLAEPADQSTASATVAAAAAGRAVTNATPIERR